MLDIHSYKYLARFACRNPETDASLIIGCYSNCHIGHFKTYVSTNNLASDPGHTFQYVNKQIFKNTELLLPYLFPDLVH